MDTTKNNGGPAFPCEYVKHAPGEVGNEVAIYEHSAGMTLRDYFAAKFMQGCAACSNQNYTGYQEAAADAYRMADAMLAERAK